jgi:hypothetical protein
MGNLNESSFQMLLDSHCHQCFNTFGDYRGSFLQSISADKLPNVG